MDGGRSHREGQLVGARPNHPGVKISRRVLPAVILTFMLAVCLGAALPALAYDADLWTYTRYQYLSDNHGKSNVLSSYADLSLTDMMNGRLEGHVSGWFNLDSYSGDQYKPTDYDYLRFSQAYLLYRPTDGQSWYKVGRQYLERVDNFSIDGIAAGWTYDKRWQFMAFAGPPVSFYSTTNKDMLAGAAVIFKPWWKTTLQADAYGYFGYDQGDHLATALRLTQSLPAINGTSYSRLRGLDGQVRDFYTFFATFFPDLQTSLSLSYFLLPKTQGIDELANSQFFSYFGQVFGGTDPYHRISLNLQAFLGEKVTLLAGAAAKRVLDDRSVNYNWSNLDSNVFNAGVMFNDLFKKGLSISILGNYVDNQGGDRFFDLTGEVEYQFHKSFKAAAGVTYMGYRFSYIQYPDTVNDQASVYNLDDHIGSRIYYIDLDYRPSDTHRLMLRAAYEAIDERYADAWAFELGYQWRFSWSGGGANK